VEGEGERGKEEGEKVDYEILEGREDGGEVRVEQVDVGDEEREGEKGGADNVVVKTP
jgi:hypothetical protein